MKRILLSICVMAFCAVATAQVFPVDLEATWDFKDDTKKNIVISYDLPDFEDLRYLKIVAKAYVDERLVPMRSLRGDIGEAVKVGKGKRIEWNWENDVVEIAGELRFEVTADNPTAGVDTPDEKPKDAIAKPAIPMFKVMALPVAAGGGLLLTGLLSSSGAKSDWEALTGAERTQEQYDDFNKKHKTGHWIAIGGGVIIAAGVAWFLKEKVAYNSYSESRVKIEPGIGDLSSINPERLTNYAPVGVSFNYKF